MTELNATTEPTVARAVAACAAARVGDRLALDTDTLEDTFTVAHAHTEGDTRVLTLDRDGLAADGVHITVRYQRFWTDAPATTPALSVTAHGVRTTYDVTDARVRPTTDGDAHDD